MYKVISWDTGEILVEFDKLNTAKRECRKLGHTNDHNGAYWFPVAFVGQDIENAGHAEYGVVYNPRFKRLTV